MACKRKSFWSKASRSRGATYFQLVFRTATGKAGHVRHVTDSETPEGTCVNSLLFVSQPQDMGNQHVYGWSEGRQVLRGPPANSKCVYTSWLLEPNKFALFSWVGELQATGSHAWPSPLLPNCQLFYMLSWEDYKGDGKVPKLILNAYAIFWFKGCNDYVITNYTILH